MKIFSIFIAITLASFTFGQLQKVVIIDNEDDRLGMQLHLADLPTGTDSIQVGLIHFSYHNAFSRKGTDYYFSKENIYSFNINERILAIPEIPIKPNSFYDLQKMYIRFACLDKNGNLIRETFFQRQFVFPHQKESPISLLHYSISEATFESGLQDTLKALCGQSYPNGFWELDLHGNTYFLGKGQPNKIRSFSGYQYFLNEEATSLLPFKVIAWEPYFLKRDAKILEVESAIQLTQDKEVVKFLYHPFLKDSVRINFMLNTMKPIDFQFKYKKSEVSDLSIHRGNDTIFRGVLVQQYALKAHSTYPDQSIRFNSYVSGNSKPLFVYPDGQHIHNEINLDSGKINQQFILPMRALKKDDSVSIGVKYRDLHTTSPISFSAPSSASEHSSFILGIKPNKRLKNTQVLLGELMPEGSPGYHDPFIFEFHACDDQSCKGWKDLYYEGEMIIILADTKWGQVQWNGIPTFGETNETIIYLKTAKGKEIKVKLTKE